eukprot:GHRQ01013319.1.p1 GENE.GHRQ01013319.1~~GHRQ01013319.1.p1  ORF type:complete len:240 (+),score=98.75 GHRQ01013319.1:569-1288(+)
MALTGKCVVVTGGSRGIGKALVEKLLSRQNRVIATTRFPQDASQLQQLARQHAALTITQLDTSAPQSISDWAAQVQQHTSHIDVLINNAGMYGRRLQLSEFEADDFITVFQTNAVGPFLVVQQLLKQRLLGPPGSLVVNVSSIMASHGDETVSSVTPGGYAYRASKAALNIINKALLLDLKEQQVQCCCVHPGYVKTDMTGGAGWVDVEESSSGIMQVLGDGRPLNGRWYSYTGDEIPW